ASLLTAEAPAFRRGEYVTIHRLNTGLLTFIIERETTMEWNRTAFVFPGQGSQVVGMGRDFAEAYPAARAIFDEADALLASPFSPIIFDGPEDVLNDTYNTQPALYISSLVMLAALRTEIPAAQPGFLAGHSLGEFTALAAAGAVTFGDGLHLVRERGRLMRKAGEFSPGAMAALLGLDAPQVQAICAEITAETGRAVVMANDNCPGQTVISGHEDAIDRAMEAALARGAKKAVRLAVSVAAHSPLMEPAAVEFRALLASIDFKPPTAPVYGNVSASPLVTVDDIRYELDLQLTQSVRWTESVQAMIAAGVTTFIEIGAGDVLTGLTRRIDRGIARHAVNSVDALRALLSV
ncbi:MAG: ACP S-malonyltransferase, partial [Chloroflexota bacterium]